MTGKVSKPEMLSGYKVGANISDQNKIRKLAEEGKSAQEIARILMIEPKVVQSFMPKKVGKAVGKKL